MCARCDDAQAELVKTSDSCRVLLEKAGGLRSQRYETKCFFATIVFTQESPLRHTTAVRQDIISIFLSRFTLTEAEVESIMSHDVPVGKQLFSTMDRAEKIRSDCQILLSGDDGTGTKAGLVANFLAHIGAHSRFLCTPYRIAST